MALTETLNDVRPSENIVNRPRVGGGFISGLASLGSGLASLASTSDAQFQQKQTRSALNEAEQAAFDFKTAQTNALTSQTAVEASSDEPSYASFDSALPGLVRTEADNLSKVQSAVRQGSMPQTAFDLKFESAVDRLFQKFPDQRAAIAQYFQSRGMEHFMFREFNQAVAAQDNARAQQTAQENFLYQKGIESGMFNPQTTDRATIIDGGRKWVSRLAELEIESKKLTMAKTNLEIRAERRKAMEEEANKGIRSTIISDGKDRIQGHFNTLYGLITTADQDPTGQRLTELKEVVPVMQQRILQEKQLALNTAVEVGADEASKKAITEWYDLQLQSLSTMFTGDLSRDKLTAQTYKAMQDRLGIQAAQAFPLWTQLTKLPGMSGMLQTMFSIDPRAGLSQEMADAIKKELEGYSPGSTDGLYNLQRIAAILRGETSLKVMSLPEAQKALPVLRSAIIGNGDKIVKDGDTSSGTANAFLNAAAQVSDATYTLSSGSDVTSHAKAAEMLGDKETFEGINALARNPIYADQAAQTALAMRGSAQKGILSLKTGGDWQRPFPGSPVMLDFDKQKGIVVPKIDETNYRRYVENVRTNQGKGFAERGLSAPGSNIPMSREAMLRQLDPTLRQRMDALNGYIRVIVGTSPADPTVPKGLTPQQIREAAFYGMPLEEKAAADGKTQTFEQQLQSFRRNLETNTVSTARQSTQGMADEATKGYNAVYAFGEYAKPPKPPTQMTLGEVQAFQRDKLIPATKGKVGAGPDKGTGAIGAYQFTYETLREYGPKVFGPGWENVQYSPENQERLAEALWNDRRGGNLKETWQGLPNNAPGEFANTEFADMRGRITSVESGVTVR